MGVYPGHDNLSALVKKVQVHPPSANRILLPDGRYMAYQEQGVPVDRARFSLLAPHSFLSSRLAGIPGIKVSLLKEFGVHLISYDLPGFGESDPHPNRNLNSSAMDMLHLANAVGVRGKFWVLGHSTGCMHAWAALRYIPNRIAAMLGPMVNPYEPRMTKEGEGKNLGKLSLSLGIKDEIVIEETIFEEFWYRDVEESVRQGSTTPFIEEAVLQVSNWGFNLVDLQVQKKCQRRGVLSWLKSMYGQEECELVGFLGPIHIWQGMDDQVVPPSMTEYVARVLPGAFVHKLPNEGHFSYFFFCDECHRKIFSTLLGTPQGPLKVQEETPLKGDMEEIIPVATSTME
ncbi:alpha/beta-Hydrolases superfamily protein [Quillaja saponaria]|uniref:Alpha/beta-Hydrolases superfamily protein n=1 Tax=Quillaja saponaria TaxID=32244 RepID=A0AAD7Q076_QUISA|nr:alpha/beta-Hydrolases superfamily protein [Quillaja saponaria]